MTRISLGTSYLGPRRLFKIRLASFSVLLLLMPISCVAFLYNHRGLSYVNNIRNSNKATIPTGTSDM